MLQNLFFISEFCNFKSIISQLYTEGLNEATKQIYIIFKFLKNTYHTCQNWFITHPKYDVSLRKRWRYSLATRISRIFLKHEEEILALIIHKCKLDKWPTVPKYRALTSSNISSIQNRCRQTVARDTHAAQFKLQCGQWGKIYQSSVNPYFTN